MCASGEQDSGGITCRINLLLRPRKARLASSARPSIFNHKLSSTERQAVKAIIIRSEICKVVQLGIVLFLVWSIIAPQSYLRRR